MLLTNTSAKRKIIDTQRKSLILESENIKKRQSVYEEFDEDESRHEHDLALKDSVIEHYNSLSDFQPVKALKKSTSKKNIKIPVVSTRFIKLSLIFTESLLCTC